MTLTWLILLPLIGGLAAWAAERAGAAISRWVTLVTLIAMGIMAAMTWPTLVGESSSMELEVPWIPGLGIHIALLMDGLSLPLVLLSIILSIVAVLVSWDSITERVGAFHFNVLWVLSGTIGVFLAADLFLFFFFWELMVVPMAFIIAFWGGKTAARAATKFFIFTQASGLLMLLSTVGLVWIQSEQTGQLSFLLSDLKDSPASVNRWLMLGFFLAFAVKLPIAPFHAWQADAYTQAPTGGTIILAGFLSKTGGYGLIRFCMPLFPEAASAFAPWAIFLGAFTLIYGAMVAFAQKDAKRLVAFSSLSHMGFIMVGAFAWNSYGVQGAMIFMLSHGFATSALFYLDHVMENRLGHRDLERAGGLAKLAPRFTGMAMFFVMMSLGLPASGNFVGEILVLVAAMENHVALAGLVGVGLIFPAIYSLYFIQKALHGSAAEDLKFKELSAREYAILVAMGLAVLWLGIRPQAVIHAVEPIATPLVTQVTEDEVIEQSTPLQVAQDILPPSADQKGQS